MADAPATDPAPAAPQTGSPRPAVLTSPSRWVFLGVLLWIGCILAGALAGAWLEQAQFDDPSQQTALAYLAYLPATLLGLLGVVTMLVGAIRWAVYGNAEDGPVGRSGNEQQRRMLALLESINERMLLSETAKRVAYRREDLEVMRRTIREDISRHQYDAALALIAELAQTYGYLEEAETYRDQIASARTAEQEAKITSAIAQLEDLLARREFDRAARELAKIKRLHPESERVAQLRNRVVQAREQYKQDLEREFLAANERDDVDKAMELLKELDRYLTTEDAEPLREIARGIIGKKRDNLGVQFKIAVHDKEWLRAIRVGEQIISEFPNTRMADEVRSRLDVLRERAAGQQAAARA
jgi:hypothetical protein